MKKNLYGNWNKFLVVGTNLWLWEQKPMLVRPNKQSTIAIKRVVTKKHEIREHIKNGEQKTYDLLEQRKN
jgi:hypothetical protein